MEIMIFSAIIIFLVLYTGVIDKQKFINDNEKYFKNLKEEDYDFLVYARYADTVDTEILYRKRIMYAIIAGAAFILIFLNNVTLLNLVFCFIVAFLVFKLPYFSLKNYYKQHLHEIDVMLPYYLKSLEILIQHYTVPVAIGKSIDDAPTIFQPGLKQLTDKINAGDSTINPYMDFANLYPVRDSMRMMRLLYRLGIGSQERKQQRLMMFSRTVSNLQNKAREVKYKERLNYMENQTMIMLVITGAGVMVLVLIAMMRMFAM